MSEIKRERAAAIEGERQAVAAKQNRNVVNALIALVVVGALLAFNIWYTANRIRESDRRWCELIPSMDDRLREQNSPGDEAAQFREQVHRIRVGLPCG